MDQLLSGKTILITGASSGIGKAIAIECSKRGANLIICGRDVNRLGETMSQLNQSASKCLSFDICDFDSIEDVVKQFPELDGVINSAGVNDKSLVKSLTLQKLDKIFHTNFYGPALLIKNLLKYKKLKKEASVLMISSIASSYATISNSLYAASKAAIESFCRCLALEVAPKGIRINCLRPGAVNTPILSAYSLNNEMENFKKQFPLGRIADPEEIAETALYFMSDASKWVTGTTLTIDGGITLR